MKKCPCGSNKTYASCCQKLHKGKKAQTALELMKSRYSAYALNIPEYIIKTTHPASPQYERNVDVWTQEIQSFSQECHFEKLEILHSQEHKNMAQVTFVAHLKQDGKDASFTEKSFFEKKGDTWLYRNGQLYSGFSPNMLTVKEMRMLPLSYYGDPLLRVIAQPIEKITDELLTLIAEMKETMDASGGVGLAAPQVHHSIRLFLVRAPQEDQKEDGDIEVYINPKISSPSIECWTASEGCLSIPTIHGEVPRPQEITIEYMNERGEHLSKRAKGWEARIILHENDHLDGRFFIDHLDQTTLQALTEELVQLHHRIHDPLAL